MKIPVQFDDFPMYKHGQSYEAWEADAFATIEKSKFVAFGLHDCYGEFWLPHYASFLERSSRMGRLMTLNEVADEVYLQNALVQPPLTSTCNTHV